MTTRSRTREPRIGKKEYVGRIVGRNNVIVDPNEVRKLAALGCYDTDIGTYFGVSADSISYNFKDELELGRSDMKNQLRRAMLENACVKMNPAVQIFLAKNFLSMRDMPLETEDNKPLPWNDDF